MTEKREEKRRKGEETQTERGGGEGERETNG